MKLKWLCFICLVFAEYSSYAQSQVVWGAFTHVFHASAFAGKKFRVEAAVRVDLIDSSAKAGLWARVDKKNHKIGFFYNMADKPIRSGNWAVYTIEGKIDKDAEYLVFGALYYKKGWFYFDDFKLYVENTTGTMDAVPIPNGNFEGNDFFSDSSWAYNAKANVYTISVTAKEHFSGKQSCLVDGSKLVTKKVYGDNDSTGKYAAVNGIKIYYEEYGSGEPLILLHGNSSSIALFEKQIPELSKYFHVYAIDTRGQGKSSEDGRLFTYDLFAEDMNALLGHLKLDSVNVLGWSDGGNTGLIMAMKYPEKVKRLVTMGANVFIDRTVVDKWVFKELDQQQKELEGDTSAYAGNRRRLITLLLTEPRHNFEELKKIHCPVLVIAGEKDIIKEGHTKSIAANIPHSNLLIAKKQTHYFPSEDPVLFNKIVADFFKQ